MKWEMFLILAFTPGPLNSRRDTFKVYLKPILGMCFFWMCFLGCAPRYEIWSIEQKLWEYPFKPPSDTPRSRWGPGVGRRWWLEQGVEKDSTANCHLGEMTTTLNKFNASVISFETFLFSDLMKTSQWLHIWVRQSSLAAHSWSSASQTWWAFQFSPRASSTHLVFYHQIILQLKLFFKLWYTLLL